MSMPQKQKQKGSLRKQILMTYALFSIIALGSIAAIAGGFIGVVGTTASSQTSATLTQQVQGSMRDQANATAQIIENQLQDAVYDLESLAVYTERLWAIPRDELGTRASYYHMAHVDTTVEAENGTVIPVIVNGSALVSPLDFPANRPQDAAYSSLYDMDVSFTYSHYLIFPTALANMTGNSPSGMNETFKDAVERSAFLDIPMSSLMKTKPQYTWIYMEFAIGLDRCMPWHDTEYFIFPWYIENSPVGLDLREEAYYTDARDAGGAVQWTPPYNDPSGQGFMITISRAVYNGSNLIGVLCMDLTINTVTQLVSAFKPTTNGYAFLIDDGGFVVSHPAYTASPTDESGPEIGTIEPAIPTATVTAMRNGQEGFKEVTKGGKEWYLAYNPVPISSYSVGVLVPKEDILAPVRALEQQVTLNLGIQLVVMLGIVAVILIFSLWIGISIANSVVQPIQKLTDMALKLSTEDIKQTAASRDIGTKLDRELEEKDDEIGSLTRAFKGLVKAVQEEGKKEAREGKEA
nr:cache domain-containing protein [Candidatus Sigynarchaeum springense]